MKPTQEQIDAALAYAADNETAWDNEIIDAWQQKKCVNNLLADRYAASAAILAAAYRELQEAIHSTIAKNLHLADGDDCTLKRLKDIIKFKLPEDQ
jgi:thymidylate kinase